MFCVVIIMSFLKNNTYDEVYLLMSSMMKVVLGGLYKMIRNPSMDTNNLL